VADSVTIDGGILVNGIPTNGTGSFSNGGAYTVNANRGIVLGGLGGTIQVGYGAAAGNFIAAGRLTIAGVVSGGALTKTDGGDLAFLGDNTYAGGTTITGGGLFVGEITTGAGIDGTNSSLGTGAINVNGGQLVLAGNALTIANDITLNGAPTVNNRQGGLVGGFQSGASANTLTGTLTLAGTGDRTISTWWSDKTLTLGGKVTGTGNLRVVNLKADGSNQGGIIILSNAANDYSGNTIISGATNNPTLRLGASDVIPDGAGKGNVTVDGRLEVNGFTDTINGLSGSGVVSLGDGSLLIVGNNNATGAFSGILAERSPAVCAKSETARSPCPAPRTIAAAGLASMPARSFSERPVRAPSTRSVPRGGLIMRWWSPEARPNWVERVKTRFIRIRPSI
jgi:autotransporter-associated beta strand protein